MGRREQWGGGQVKECGTIFMDVFSETAGCCYHGDRCSHSHQKSIVQQCICHVHVPASPSLQTLTHTHTHTHIHTHTHTHSHTHTHTHTHTYTHTHTHTHNQLRGILCTAGYVCLHVVLTVDLGTGYPQITTPPPVVPRWWHHV